MKKNILIALLFGVIMGGLVYAAPRDGVFVDKTYKNNGDTRVSFSVTIDSTSWTQIIPEDSERRYAVIEATSTSNEGFICVSTFTTTSIECTNSVIGQKIGLTRHYIEDYSEAILYGRNSSASSLYLIGEYQYDSAD